jgi:hypothetical protein
LLTGGVRRTATEFIIAAGIAVALQPSADEGSDTRSAK